MASHTGNVCPDLVFLQLSRAMFTRFDPGIYHPQRSRSVIIDDGRKKGFTEGDFGLFFRFDRKVNSTDRGCVPPLCWRHYWPSKILVKTN